MSDYETLHFGEAPDPAESERAEHDAALVAATRRQCAALACAGCRGEWFMHQAKPIEVSRGRWAHLQVTPNEHYCAAECVASAIWALADREPEG